MVNSCKFSLFIVMKVELSYKCQTVIIFNKIKGLTDSWRVSVETSCAAIPNGNFRMLSYVKDEWNPEWKHWQRAINQSRLLSR